MLCLEDICLRTLQKTACSNVTGIVLYGGLHETKHGLQFKCALTPLSAVLLWILSCSSEWSKHALRLQGCCSTK